MIDVRQGYLAMLLFVWEYDGRNEGAASIFDLKTDSMLDASGNSFDPAMWDDWLNCVARVRAGDIPEELASRG